MIGPSTTFVVGAGGSDPYGLPIASTICRNANVLDHRSPVYQLLWAAVGDVAPVDRTLNDLRGHGAGSIDQFLEHHQHNSEAMTTGKLLIAALLGESMAAVRPGAKGARNATDWIEHVILQMSTGAATPADFARGAKGVKFVTFNFDSLIEERTAGRIRAIYSAHSDVETAVNSISVTHVHGRISDPPKEPLYKPDVFMDGYTGSGISGKWIDWTLQAASNIKIVLEEIDAALLKQIQDTIDSADILCFLGFSYDRGNLAKLGFPKTAPNHRVTAYGSAFGLTQASRHQVQARLGAISIELTGPTDRCLDLLHNKYVIRD